MDFTPNERITLDVLGRLSNLSDKKSSDENRRLMRGALRDAFKYLESTDKDTANKINERVRVVHSDHCYGRRAKINTARKFIDEMPLVCLHSACGMFAANNKAMNLKTIEAFDEATQELADHDGRYDHWADQPRPPGHMGMLIGDMGMLSARSASAANALLNTKLSTKEGQMDMNFDDLIAALPFLTQELSDDGMGIGEEDVLATAVLLARKYLGDDAEPDDINRTANAMVSGFGLLRDEQSLDQYLKTGEKPDSYYDIRKQITDTTKTDEIAQPQDDDGIVLPDASMRPAIDMLIKQATGGKITGINVYLDELRDLRSTVSKLSSRRAASPAATSGAVSGTNDGDLTYEVEWKPANEVFPSPTGKKVSMLGFEIPTLTWKNADGDVVQPTFVPDVDDTYRMRAEMLIPFLLALAANKNTWFHGHYGTGKTTFVEQVCARIGFPVTRVNLDSNIERPDLVGQERLYQEEGATVSHFVEGIIPKAMQQPGFLIVDECDAGRPDILFVIQRALERKGLTLTEDGGRLVVPHELFRFAATANTRGQGDEFGVYPGVRVMNGSFMDRFEVMIGVDYLKEEDERALLQSQFPTIPDETVEKMVAFAGEIRRGFKEGQIMQTLSPRGLMTMGEMYTMMASLVSDEKKVMRMLLRYTTLERATNDTRTAVDQIIDKVWA